MARPKIIDKIISDNKDEKKAVKFFSGNKDGHTFYMLLVDENDQPIFVTDADGNNKRRKGQFYNFTKVPVRDPKTGKTSQSNGYSYFITSEETYGKMHRHIVDALTMSARHPDSKIFTSEAWDKKFNPHSLELKETQNAAMQLATENDALREELAQLRVRLGGK